MLSTSFLSESDSIQSMTRIAGETMTNTASPEREFRAETAELGGIHDHFAF